MYYIYIVYERQCLRTSDERTKLHAGSASTLLAAPAYRVTKQPATLEETTARELINSLMKYYYSLRPGRTRFVMGGLWVAAAAVGTVV